MLWLGIHRHDLPIGSFEWQRFVGAVHNGVSRLRRLVDAHPNLKHNGVYVYPYYVEVNGQPAGFETVGSVALSSEPCEFLGVSPFYPSGNRVGRWLDWVRTDWSVWLESFRSLKLSHSFWFVDNIPDWYRALVRAGLEAEFEDQVGAFVKFLRNVHDVPVVGNIYNGGSWLSRFLSVADGAFFENSYWFWYSGTTLRPLTQRNQFLSTVDVVRDAGRSVFVGVPYLDKYQVIYFRDMVSQLGKDVVYLEYRNPESRLPVNDRKLIPPSIIEP